MSSLYTTGAAPANKAAELVRMSVAGKFACRLSSLDEQAVVSFFRKRDNVLALTSAETKQSEIVLDQANLSNTPAVPGSLRFTGSGLPTLVDRDRDGILYEDRDKDTVLSTGGNGVTSVAGTRTLTSSGATFDTDGVRAGDKVMLGGHGLDAGVFTIAARTSATVLTINEDWPVGGQSGLRFEIIPVDNARGSINYFDGAFDLSYPSSDTPGGKATVLGTGVFPLNLDPGQTVIIDVDAAGDATATFDAVAAKHTAASGTFAAMAAETMEVRFSVGGVAGDWQTVTFGTEATIQLAVDLINAQLTGGYAKAQGAQDVDLFSDGKGTGAKVETQNVAVGIVTKLGIADAGDDDGTGDVSDINAVTFAEAKTVIEADVSDSLCVEEDGKMRVSSDTVTIGANSKLEVSGGTARTIFGFDTTLHLGSDDDAKISVTCAYVSTEVVPAKQSVVREVTNLPNDELIVHAAGARGAGGRVKVEILGGNDFQL